MKTVAIVGAGPGGLCTAKVFLRSKSNFRVHVFDRKSSVGGLWAIDKDKPYESMLHPDMQTNISRFNISFSDAPWATNAPMFPRARMVGQYLESYKERFLSEATMMLNTNVTSASPNVEHEGDPQSIKWHLTYEQSDASGNICQSEGVFDYLIMAAGFFPEAFIPSKGCSTVNHVPIKQLHSTKIRSIADIAPSGDNGHGTILIVGGGMSGAEIATTMAAEMSNAIYAPGSTGSPYRDLKLVQVVPGPFYALPLLVPKPGSDPAGIAPEFIPLDMALYELGRRPSGPVELGIGKLSRDFIEKSHRFIRDLVGGDQSELGQPCMGYESVDGRSTRVAIAENYAEYLRAGDIALVSGRVIGIQSEDMTTRAFAKISTKEGEQEVKDVIAVIWATGFNATPSLSVLPKAVLDQLDYDPDNKRMPLILDMDLFYTARADATPNLAFVGYHEGQAWPGMELQARFIEQMWSGNSSGLGAEKHSDVTNREQLRDLRQSMRSREPDLPMYWLGDYAGLVSSIARRVNIERNDLDWPERTGPVVAARYADGQSDPQAIKQALDELDSLVRDSRERARFVSRAAFRALHGTWKIERRLNSFLAGFPSGTLEGTASFNPRYPTDGAYDAEYLYVEQGTFTNDQGLSFGASRRYVYRYQESTDKITAWFVQEDGKTVDYFFHDLVFDPSSRKFGWVAKTDHLCIKDMYKSTYCFQFKGPNIRSLDITHSVKGPNKNYVSSTKYVRPAAECLLRD